MGELLKYKRNETLGVVLILDHYRLEYGWPLRLHHTVWALVLFSIATCYLFFFFWMFYSKYSRLHMKHLLQISRMKEFHSGCTSGPTDSAGTQYLLVHHRPAEQWQPCWWIRFLQHRKFRIRLAVGRHSHARKTWNQTTYHTDEVKEIILERR